MGQLAGLICSLANLHRNPDKEPYTIEQFLPEKYATKPSGANDDGTMMLRKAAKAVALMGGTIEPEVASILERAQR
jgi:hypothetical protein